MTRRPFPVVLVLVLGAAGFGAALVGATPAAAYVSATGSGHGHAGVGSLAGPAVVTAEVDGGAVDVSWSAVTAPGPGGLAYVVHRTDPSGGPDVAVCGSATTPVSGTSCSDTDPVDGSVTYSVEAVWSSWTSPPTSSDPVDGEAPAPAATTTTLDLSTPDTTVGVEDGVTYSVDVATADATVASGSVDVVAGSTYLCTVTLPDTSCTSDPAALVGSTTPYPVIATFSGGDGAGGSASSAQELTVYDAPAITTTQLASAVDGETGYRQVLTATGGMPALTWLLVGGALPGGLTLDTTTGAISGTLGSSASTESVTVEVADLNGAISSADLTITVTQIFAQQSSMHTTSDASSVALTLYQPVIHGDALVLSLDQACIKSAGGAVTSPVTAVSGGSVTWVKAVATSCSADGDAELWYGTGAAGAASGAKVTVTLQAAAPVQYASVAEYSGVNGRDTAAGALATATGSGSVTAPGTVTPATSGELVVASTFVTRPTPLTLTGLVGPFVALNPVTPYQGVAVYAVDATTAGLAPAYTQTSGGVPAAGPWSSVAAVFTTAS